MEYYKYFNGDMHGFPVFADHASLIEALKKMLITGFGEMKPDQINKNELYFNSEYKTNQHSIYKISDGSSEILTHVIKVDDNKIHIVENIDALNKQNITISAAPAGDWRYKQSDSMHIFTSLDAEFTIDLSDKTWRITGDVETDKVALSLNIHSNKSSFIFNKFGNAFLKFGRPEGPLISYNFLSVSDNVKCISNASGSTGSQITPATINAIIFNNIFNNAKKIYQGGDSERDKQVDWRGLAEFSNKPSDHFSFSDVLIENVPIGILSCAGFIDEKTWAYNDVFIKTKGGYVCILTTSTENKKSGLPIFLRDPENV